MLSLNDFSKKQIVFVFANNGEKIAYKNDNLIVKDKEDNIKFQISLYRLYIVYIIGDISLTTVILKKAKKFGFSIALLSTNFRLYEMIGDIKLGNTLLKEKQYRYNGISIAKQIVCNKILNEINTLKNIRKKDNNIKESISILNNYMEKSSTCDDYYLLLSYEGNAAKQYFKSIFDNVDWKGRKPRIKFDYINSSLDIGYTILFTFIEIIVNSFGFDTYVGVLHKQFYMRKSLICDFVEPFRTIIDEQVRKSINLKQIKEDDFMIINRKYILKYENSTKYANIFLNAIIAEKDAIFLYVQEYYRAFMKSKPIEKYPIYERELFYDNN